MFPKETRLEGKEWKLNNLTIGLVVSPLCTRKQARCLHYFIQFSFLIGLIFSKKFRWESWNF